MSLASQRPTRRRTAALAAVALCLRLLLPLLHGGAGCDHHAFVGASGAVYEVCSCGDAHDHDAPGDHSPSGEAAEDGKPIDDAPCLACKVEEQSPGGATLAAIDAPRPAPAHACPQPAPTREATVAACALPPSRAPPHTTV